MKIPCVYILASLRNGTLYIGVTSELAKRIWQHKTGILGGFTDKVGAKFLVYFEVHETMVSVIRREKALKGWRRAWKIQLIEETNPGWVDLAEQILGDEDEC